MRVVERNTNQIEPIREIRATALDTRTIGAMARVLEQERSNRQIREWQIEQPHNKPDVAALIEFKQQFDQAGIHQIRQAELLIRALEIIAKVRSGTGPNNLSENASIVWIRQNLASNSVEVGWR